MYIPGSNGPRFRIPRAIHSVKCKIKKCQQEIPLADASMLRISCHTQFPDILVSYAVLPTIIIIIIIIRTHTRPRKN